MLLLFLFSCLPSFSPFSVYQREKRQGKAGRPFSVFGFLSHSLFIILQNVHARVGYKMKLTLSRPPAKMMIIVFAKSEHRLKLAEIWRTFSNSAQVLLIDSRVILYWSRFPRCWKIGVQCLDLAGSGLSVTPLLGYFVILPSSSPQPCLCAPLFFSSALFLNQSHIQSMFSSTIFLIDLQFLPPFFKLSNFQGNTHFLAK